jgi:hypothetical protein
VPANPDRFGPTDRLVGHVRRYSKDDLRSMMEAAGLNEIVIRSWGMPAGYVLEMARNLRATLRRSSSVIGTAGSGRYHQQAGSFGRALQLAFRPLTVLQAPFVGSGMGVGFVAVGTVTR